uniref:Putative secreted protein n=1 Tax=Anopheles marajoara TaxID=58244 RepID=A0A2M4C655_9DIPT
MLQLLKFFLFLRPSGSFAACLQTTTTFFPVGALLAGRFVGNVHRHIIMSVSLNLRSAARFGDHQVFGFILFTRQRINLCLLGPFVPKVGIVDVDVTSVGRRREGGLRKGGSLFALHRNDLGTTQENRIDIFFAKLVASIIVHHRSIGSLLEQIFNLLLR